MRTANTAGRLSSILLGISFLSLLVSCDSTDPITKPEPGEPVLQDEWKLQTTGAQLHAVWGSSSKDVFAAGTNGTILHYDGVSVTSTASGTDSWRLTGIWGSSGDNVFAADGEGPILHYDGRYWRPWTAANGNEGFDNVWGSSEDDVYFAGSHSLHSSLQRLRLRQHFDHRVGESQKRMGIVVPRCVCRRVWGNHTALRRQSVDLIAVRTV